MVTIRGNLNHGWYVLTSASPCEVKNTDHLHVPAAYFICFHESSQQYLLLPLNSSISHIFFPLFLPSNPDYLLPSIQSVLLLIKIAHSASGLSAPPASWFHPAPHFGFSYPEPLSQAPHVHVHVHGPL